MDDGIQFPKRKSLASHMLLCPALSTAMTPETLFGRSFKHGKTLLTQPEFRCLRVLSFAFEFF